MVAIARTGFDELTHVRAPKAVHFPSEETVPESKRHLLVRTALFQVLQIELGGRATVGSDQFVYWNARDPTRKLAPDVFVHTGHPDHVFDSWKIWERGAPQLAVEIVSESDAQPSEWEGKLERYQEAGFQQVVRFDPFARPGQRLRVWDRMQGDLVERVVCDDCTLCTVLSLWWLVTEDPELGPVVTLARDRQGQQLLPGPRAQGKSEGLQQGKSEGLQQAARKLLASGMPRDQIAALLGLDPASF